MSFILERQENGHVRTIHESVSIFEIGRGVSFNVNRLCYFVV